MKRQIFAQYAKRVFINSSSLKTHEKIHLEIKQFECKICGKNFRRSNHLKSHEKIHARNAL